MRIVFKLAFLLLCTRSLHAQDSTYSFRIVDDASLAQTLDKLSQETAYTFYYAPQWVDSIRVGGRRLDGDIEQIVSLLLEGTRLDFVIVENKVILTYNTPIISSLPEVAAGQEAPDNSYLFAREYGGESDEQDPEEKLHVIGSKSKMKIGGSSVLAGFIRSGETNEPLTGASVEAVFSRNSTTADASGFYSLTIGNGKERLVIRYAGMKQTHRDIVVFSDGKLDVSMDPEVVMLDEFVLRGDAGDNIERVEMGINRIELEEMKNIPKVLGENDVVKTVLAMPGVQSVGEGSSGINVRGGKTDQNLLLFNNATLYNPFHFFGFFSSFNADLLESTELYKSSVPVNYGGRLASVLDVKMKAGNKKKITGRGGISPVTGQLSLEVPLIKEKTSMIIGGRSTYSDWLLNSIDDETISNSDPFFFDVAGGIDHSYGGINNINVSAYYSYDRFRLSTDSLYSYANFSTSLNWMHHFNDKLSGSFSAALSRYEYRIDYDKRAKASFDFGFDIQNISSQLAITYTPAEAHSISFGVDAKHYEVNPGYKLPSSDSSLVIGKRLDREKGIEAAIFLADNFTVNNKISFYYGIRYSGFIALGPGVVNTYQELSPKNENTISGSVYYFDNEVIKRFHGPEWRISGRYAFDKQTSLKISYNRTRQYIHMLSNNVSISPVDIWKLSDSHILPQRADQYALGLFKNLQNNTIEASIEIYYKDIDNLLDYKTGANLVLNERMETDVIQGEGKAYGVELLVKKNTGDLNGWVAYTYSRSLQRFTSDFDEEKINNGVYFPSNFDKPHSFNLISNYKLTRRYSLSLNMVYASGRPVTYPTAYYEMGGVEVVHYSDRNEFRIPDYFRIDIGFNLEGNHKLKKLAHSFWSFSVYNVLGRNNPYSVYFENDNGRIQGYQLSVLANPIPSISYKFEF